MKTSIFNITPVKYKNFNSSQLATVLENTEMARNKSAILIAMGALPIFLDKELFGILLKEVENEENNHTREFSTLTIAMIAAALILKSNITDYTNQLKKIIEENWNADAKSDFIYFLKSEEIKF